MNVTRQSSSQIAGILRGFILSGRLAVGASIRQDALAEELGVSKIPLREALARLEEEGLLVNEKNRGFFVRRLSAAEAEEIYALRLKMEPEMSALACRLATSRDQASAKVAQRALEHAVDRHSKEVGPLNTQFHMALITPCGRPLTTSLIDRLQNLSDRYVAAHLQWRGYDKRLHDEHGQMLKLWLERDEAGVMKITAHHISDTLRELRKQFAAETARTGS